jgi:hypothetical protein
MASSSKAARPTLTWGGVRNQYSREPDDRLPFRPASTKYVLSYPRGSRVKRRTGTRYLRFGAGLRTEGSFDFETRAAAAGRAADFRTGAGFRGAAAGRPAGGRRSARAADVTALAATTFLAATLFAATTLAGATLAGATLAGATFGAGTVATFAGAFATGGDVLTGAAGEDFPAAGLEAAGFATAAATAVLAGMTLGLAGITLGDAGSLATFAADAVERAPGIAWIGGTDLVCGPDLVWGADFAGASSWISPAVGSTRGSTRMLATDTIRGAVGADRPRAGG